MFDDSRKVEEKGEFLCGDYYFWWYAVWHCSMCIVSISIHEWNDGQVGIEIL
ncbi:TPA: hypothetical protein ACF3QR_001464 [Enterococcus faecium]|uniref:hypothetical protein n=1 Tax=Enterococcus faecium TaxID=1352 RepID=UPI000408336C|nr:hypothetical protein [Enterococcus faecium]